MGGSTRNQTQGKRLKHEWKNLLVYKQKKSHQRRSETKQTQGGQQCILTAVNLNREKPKSAHCREQIRQQLYILQQTDDQ